MSFSPRDFVEDHEWLYRRIPPEYYDFERDRVTSQAFFSSHGVSVDRQGDRSEEDVIAQLLKEYPHFGVVRCAARCVREAGAEVFSDPLPDNPYHAVIWRSVDEKLELTRSQRRALVKRCILVRKPVSP